MSAEANIGVRVGGDVSGLSTALNKGKRDLDSFSNDAKIAAKAAAGIAAAAVAAGAALATKLTANGLAAADAQAKLARRLGATNDGLKALQISSSDAGIDSAKLTKSIENLNSRLGEAERGTGAAADALDRLNLSAGDLSRMDVDERLATIADRMVELDFSTQQAGDELRQMGIRNQEMINLMLQGGDAIRNARREVGELGLSLSDVDAAQIEKANDSFARFGMLMDGVSNQLAIQVAPVLDAVSRLFTDAAKEAGGLGGEVEQSFNTAIRAASFVADAVGGVSRVFEVAGKGVALFALTVRREMYNAAAYITGAPVDAINNLIELLRQVPGVDIPDIKMPKFAENLRAEYELAWQATEEAKADIEATLMRPLPGTVFEQFVSEARKAGEELRSSIGLGPALDIPGAGGGNGGSSGDDPLKSIRERYITEQELLRQHKETMALIGQEWDAAKFDTESEWMNVREQAEKEHQDKLIKLRREGMTAAEKFSAMSWRSQVSTVAGSLQQMTAGVAQHSRKMFEINKGAAIASAVVDGYKGVAKTMSEYPYPVNIGMAAAHAASAFAQVQAIRSSSYSGGGAGRAPSTTTTPNTPVTQAGGSASGGGASNSGPTYTLAGLDPSKLYNGRDLIAIIQEAVDNGAPLRIG